MFESVIKKLKSINLSDIALKEFERVKEEAFDLNTGEQLFSRGIDSKGNSLGPYAPLTVRLRSEAGLPTDRITLKVTGRFHDKWEGDFKKWPVKFTSSDDKTGELLFLFGPEIFGLTPENIKVLINDSLKENIQDRLKKIVSKSIQDL